MSAASFAGHTEKSLAASFLEFINNSPSQFHAVAQISARLDAAGFQHLSEKSVWSLQPLGKYYVTRNQSSVIAFTVGGAWKPGNGFSIIGSHTDSPVLKLKPVSRVTKAGFLQVGVEPYGGGLWHTWFDRDLTVAGRVIVEENGNFVSRLVHVPRSILRIPSLAIHLNREVNDKGFIFNKQTHLLPVLATSIKQALAGDNDAPAGDSFAAQHHTVLIKLLAEQLNVKAESIKDFELCLCDTQAAVLSGAYQEFIHSRALDNLMMSFVGITSLLASVDSLPSEELIRMVALFDNEEIGSASLMGAASNWMYQTLNRLNADPASYDAAIARSFLVSADMAHAISPNYQECHEENHKPFIHKGLVIKSNANLRYATNGLTSFLLEEIARRHSLPVQKFCVRNDVMCGSTIGPILSSSCGLRTVDVGIPQLSMHSLREMCGTTDVFTAFQLLTAFFKEFTQLDKKLIVGNE